jgi:hypothetical protein
MNPWSGHKLAGAKEFWKAVTVPRLQKVNPDCVVNVDLHNKMAEPSILIK